MQTDKQTNKQDILRAPRPIDRAGSEKSEPALLKSLYRLTGKSVMRMQADLPKRKRQ